MLRRQIAMPQRKPRVLYVEEPSRIREQIAAVLQTEGFDVELAPSARAGAVALGASAFDAIVLDASLPAGGAPRWVASRRRAGLAVPVVVLCGLGDERQVVASYQAGARLCLQRPLGGPGLAAHLGALLAPPQPPAFRLGHVTFDTARERIAFPDGSTAAVRSRELALLLALSRNTGRAVTYDRLVDDVWPTGKRPSLDSGLYVVVSRLRKRLGRFAWMLRHVSGTGYMLTARPADAPLVPRVD